MTRRRRDIKIANRYVFRSLTNSPIPNSGWSRNSIQRRARDRVRIASERGGTRRGTGNGGGSRTRAGNEIRAKTPVEESNRSAMIARRVRAAPLRIRWKRWPRRGRWWEAKEEKGEGGWWAIVNKTFVIHRSICPRYHVSLTSLSTWTVPIREDDCRD